MMAKMVGDLFQRPYEGAWGLRGDPYLWALMQVRFETNPMPADQFELADLLASCFTALTGANIERDAPVYVQFLSTTRGMSAGMVSPYWWRTTGIPVLLDRAWALEAFPPQQTRQDMPEVNQHMIEFVILARRRQNL